MENSASQTPPTKPLETAVEIRPRRALPLRVLVASGEQANANLASLQLLYACDLLREHFLANAFQVDKLHLVLGKFFGILWTTADLSKPLDATQDLQQLLDIIWPHMKTAPSFLEALLLTANSQLAMSCNQRPTALEEIASIEMIVHHVCRSCGEALPNSVDNLWIIPLKPVNFENGTALKRHISEYFAEAVSNLEALGSTYSLLISCHLQNSTELCYKCAQVRQCSKWISLTKTGSMVLIHVVRESFVKDKTTPVDRINVDTTIDLGAKQYQLKAALLHCEAFGYSTLVRQGGNVWVEVDQQQVSSELDPTSVYEQLGNYCQVLLYEEEQKKTPEVEDQNSSRLAEEMHHWAMEHSMVVMNQISGSPSNQLAPALQPARPYGYCGLANLGLSCYANACLQVLYTLPCIRQYLVANAQQGPFHKSLGELFAAMEAEAARNEEPNKAFTCLQPAQFMKQFREIKSDFRAYQMADAQEFLAILLELVHQEANQATKQSKPKSEPKTADEAWQFHVDYVDNSFLSRQFMGQIESKLCCRVCTHQSLSWSCIWQLQLSPGVDSSEKKEEVITLNDCIKAFLAEETLADDCRPMCVQCNTRQPATKRVIICRTPLLLLVHLTRFEADGSKNKRPVAIDEHIELCSRHYSLSSAVLHQGSEKRGHYFTLHKQAEGQWVRLDDDHVHKDYCSCQAKQLLQEQAYLCMYELTN